MSTDIIFSTGIISQLSVAEEKRLAEREASLALLRKMLGNSSAVIDRLPSGVPILPDYPDLHISISHSADFVAVAVASLPIGIDIQTPSHKLERVKERFVSELDCIPAVCSDPLLLLWTIKEAVYKANLTSEIPLKSIVIDSITISGNNYISEVSILGRQFRCQSHFYNSFCLSTAIPHKK